MCLNVCFDHAIKVLEGWNLGISVGCDVLFARSGFLRLRLESCRRTSDPDKGPTRHF